MKGWEGGKGKGAAGMEYGSGGGGGGGGRGGVQPPSAAARGMAGTDTTDAAWHKHEQMILMESRHKQQCEYTTPQSCFSASIYCDTLTLRPNPDPHPPPPYFWFNW